MFSEFKANLNSALIKNTHSVAKEILETVNETHQTVKKTDQGVDMLSTYLSIHIY